MHKLIKTTVAAVTLVLLFGAAFSAHAEEASWAGKIAGLWLDGAVAPITLANQATKALSGSSIPELALKKTLDIGAGIGSSFIGWVSVKAIGYLLFVLSYIAGFIGSTVFTLAGLFVEFGLYLNTTILDGEVVQLGWRFCRDLANLGFTIGIVVIAYATMLGIESYSMKKLIQNFVIAAVMVNFSFSIAGFAIDISNMLTHFFVNAAIGGGAGQVGVDSIHKFTETLASTFNPQKLLVTDSSNIQVYQSLSSNDGIIAAVLSMFFVALFTAFCALGMLMVGLTTISRFVYLSGLIILMPLAVLCYAFPNTKKHFGEWYKAFTCQLTYLPTATFAMYIVIMFVQVKSNIGFGNAQAVDLSKLLDTFEAAKGAPGGLTSTRTLELMAAPFRTITDMILVLTMLFYGITKSRTIGCAGGDIALKWAQGLRGWAIGTVTGAPAWAGRKALSGGVDEEGRNRGTRLSNIMSNIPLVRRLIPRLNDFAAGTSKNIGNLETQNKKLGDVQLMTKMRSLEILTSAEDMAAAAKVAAERGLFSEDDPEKGLMQKEFDRFIPAVKRYGMEKDILKKAPHFYGKFGWDLSKDETTGKYNNEEDAKKLDDLFKKDFKAEDTENLNVEALEDLEVVRRLSGAHLEKLPKGDKHRAAFSKSVLKLRKEMSSAKFDEYFQKTFAKPEAADALTPELLKNKDVVRNLTSAHLKRFSGAGKEKEREAFLATVNEKDAVTGEYVFTDRELADFGRKNFAKPKDLEDIHPDLIRNERFFRGVINEKHIEQMNKEPDTNQQAAIFDGLRASYAYVTADTYTKGGYSEEEVVKLDKIAKKIIDKKDEWQWSPVVNDSKSKESFAQIEAQYRSRHQVNPPQQRPQPDVNDDDAYGPSPKGPYPAGGGGPSSGSEPKRPPKPPTPPPPPPPPFPAGAGPSVKPTPPPPPVTNVSPNPAPQGKAWEPQPTIDAVFESKSVAGAEPKRITDKGPLGVPTADPSEKNKGVDIGKAIDELLKGGSATNNPEYVLQEEFPEPPPLLVPMMPDTSGTQATQSQATPTIKTPKTEDLSEDFLESLEAATNPQLASKPVGTPITPPELNTLVTQEAKRIKTEGRGWQPPEPIDAAFEPRPAPASAPLKRITLEGSVTPPEPTLPEPIRTALREKADRENNQLSVIPKSDQAERKNIL